MNFEVNFFTYCDGIYKEFIPLFILSHLYHNEDSFSEVCVNSDIDENIKNSLNLIYLEYPARFKITKINSIDLIFNNVTYRPIPNTVRFFIEPSVRTNYVYITDIDIICLEPNIVKIHTNNMKNKDLPYSNIVRPVKNENQVNKRLSGLHFTPYDNYYPIPNFEDLCKKGLLNHDEVFLYEIVKKRYPDFLQNDKYRPVHGIHVSPNRAPEGNLNWGMSGLKNKWNKFYNSDIFKKIEPTFTEMIKNKISIINNYYLNESSSL